MEIKNYIINEDLTVDVNSEVYILDKELKEIPIRFGIVNGNFDCSYNELTNFEYYYKSKKENGLLKALSINVKLNKKL